MCNAVHFGAGRIGRGFVGQLLFEAGCRTTFVDADAALVAELHARDSYPLRLVDTDGGVRTLTVENVTALPAGDTQAVTNAILTADILSTAVGIGTLPRIAPLLAAGITARAKTHAPPVSILLCENGWHVADTLHELLLPHLAPAAQNYLSHSVGLVECVVGRMVPAPSEAAKQKNALLVVAEDFTELPINACAVRGVLPPLPGLVRTQGFDAYEARKLFLHNMGHAALAYAGWQAGHEFVWQCVEDEACARVCRAAMEEAQQALSAEYGFDPAALSMFTHDLMRRFASRALSDTVARVAADPLRKLGPQERLVGAVRLCEKHGLATAALTQVIALALAYDNPADPSTVLLQQGRAQAGNAALLAAVCGIQAASPLLLSILQALKEHTYTYS